MQRKFALQNGSYLEDVVLVDSLQMIGRVVPDAVHLKKSNMNIIVNYSKLVNKIGSTHHKAAEKQKSSLKLLIIRIQFNLLQGWAVFTVNKDFLFAAFIS